MLKLLSQLYVKQNAQMLMQANLAEYQLELVHSEAQTSYHAKLSEFYREGIKRLQMQLKDVK